ncbi:uncharacterized protein MAM_02459 [Metarhizium album ARSEF 1941]|uniref:Uncharacterized protein n=1 Tax=Metarhizium album (strain ARSEF 1941) TaxID=1081103 RepID=A0A0B2WU60_METAS|nr:uncharacterized protein MAM_02459 [Metarhizium album ARSEF 1941]KHN99606.1 hypothetical protein MAM_02459 [Metarhizium album ARSEF 1941]
MRVVSLEFYGWTVVGSTIAASAASTPSTINHQNYKHLGTQLLDRPSQPPTHLHQPSKLQTSRYDGLRPPNMRCASIATGVLCLVFVSSAAAQPPRDSPADACCCCDIRSNQISCDRSVSKQDCACAAVVCPANAPTVYRNGRAPPTSAAGALNGPPAQRTRAPVPEKNGVPDIAGAESGSGSGSGSGSDQDAVRLPPFPAVTAEASRAFPPPARVKAEGFVTVTVSATARAKRVPLGCAAPSPAAARQFQCCCCNPGIGKMVCKLREQQDCVCAAVVCPEGAETIHVQPPACTDV